MKATKTVTLGLAAMLSTHLSPAAARDDGSARPNVIVIISDDQGYADVGFNGSQEIPTPNIDRIASEGVRFTRGYVTYSVCAPSRAGLMTGRYQARFGFDRNPNGNPADIRGGLPRSEETMAEMLKRAGYTSKAVGKWHLGTHKDLRPRARGFDEFYGFLEGGHNYMPHSTSMEDISQSKKLYDWYQTKLVDNGKRVDFDQYLTDELSDRATEFVGRMAREDKPFFLYLAYNAPHSPLQATQEYLDRFPHIKDKKRKTYAAMISAMDDGIGEVLSELDRTGLAQDTIVVFLSDNGGVVNGSTGEQPIADNGPLRGGKSSLWEGGIRVPFAMRWPAKFKAGIDYDRPVSSMDIFATLAAHNALEPKNPLDGVNLVPFVTGADTGEPHAALFWRKFDNKSYAAVVNNVKFLFNNNSGKLFNLRTDIDETTNIAGENAETAKKLEAVTAAWNSQMAPKPAFPPLGSWPQNANQKNKGKGGDNAKKKKVGAQQ